MEQLLTNIPDVILLKPRVFEDRRGYFYESYNHRTFCAMIGRNVSFVQDNQSLSGKAILRGLHFQKPPHQQGKLVRVISGAVVDVAVDIRHGSPTYGQHVMAELNATNKHMLWIPPGFAHGFLTLEDHTVFAYKCTGYYHKDSEDALLWNDPDLHIKWPVDQPILSEKDRNANSFADYQAVF